MHKVIAIFIVALTLVNAVQHHEYIPGPDGKVSFDGHKVVKVQITNEKQKELVEAQEWDIWSHESNVVIGVNDILLAPGDEVVLKEAGLTYDVMIEDVQSLIDEQEAEHKRVSSLEDASWFDTYHTFEAIVAEVKRLAGVHASITEFVPSIGKSIQGRDIPAIYIHGGPSMKNRTVGAPFAIPRNVPKIFFTGGQHAREWISHATVTYIINELLTGYGRNTQVTNILNKIAFVIVPVVNPDGYDFTWTSNRLWRKNRRLVTGNTYGVDLNRNWDTHWGGEGSSRTPSSDTYCGTGPFSEPETKAVSTFLLSLGNVKAAIDWHSYSELILRPWGWSRTQPANDAELTRVGAGIQSAIRATTGKVYTNQASWQLYFTTGSAQDYYFEVPALGTSIAYTIELRDTGTYGFQLPAVQIIPTGSECFNAMLFFFDYVITNRLE